VLLTASALALGFLHGLGADHLMAIAALSVRPAARAGSRTHPVRVAVGFALGHALLLLAGSALVILLGWQIPVLVERTGERVGGVLLILLGAFGLWVAFNQRLYGHTHAHGDPSHVHYHVHFGQAHGHPSDGHQHLPGLLGAVFAVSGLRAITLMAPIGSALDGNVVASMFTVAYLVIVFAAGILLSMSLFGIVLTRLLGSPFVIRAVGRSAAAVTALASIGLGIYWLAG